MTDDRAQSSSVEDLAGARFKDLCFDVNDTGQMARFWSAVLGLAWEERDAGALLRNRADEHAVWINEAPEPKSVKNRIHWDVWRDTDGLLSEGAGLLRARDDEIGWDVLTDPEGNEFCVFSRD